MFAGTSGLPSAAVIRIVARSIEEHPDGERDFPFLLRCLCTLFRLRLLYFSLCCFSPFSRTAGIAVDLVSVRADRGNKTGTTGAGAVTVKRARPLFQDTIYLISVPHSPADAKPSFMFSAGHRIAFPYLLALNAAGGIRIIRRTAKDPSTAGGFIQVI